MLLGSSVQLLVRARARAVALPGQQAALKARQLMRPVLVLFGAPAPPLFRAATAGLLAQACDHPQLLLRLLDELLDLLLPLRGGLDLLLRRLHRSGRRYPVEAVVVELIVRERAGRRRLRRHVPLKGRLTGEGVI